MNYQSLKKKDLKEILLQQSTIALTKEMIDDILEDYDTTLGARGILSKMKKYLVKVGNS